MMYRHGLRVSEAIGLRRDEVDLDHARLWVHRLKRGLDVEHPIAGDELRAIKRYIAIRTEALPWLFISERGQPLTRQSVNYLVAEAAGRAGLPPVHPHMLRHSCGFALANRGYDLRLIQDSLGHRDPKHTVHYTRVAAGRFEGFGVDSERFHAKSAKLLPFWSVGHFKPAVAAGETNSCVVSEASLLDTTHMRKKRAFYLYLKSGRGRRGTG
jgi:type 1 fimbriae regulatory protein FimB